MGRESTISKNLIFHLSTAGYWLMACIFLLTSIFKNRIHTGNASVVIEYHFDAYQNNKAQLTKVHAGIIKKYEDLIQ